MRERGQVFTLDMLFALILVAAFISVSGQAYELAASQTRSYSTRYSLERIANDAADVLVKTSGDPRDWENDLDNLRVPGLAVPKKNSSNSIANSIEMEKIAWLRELARASNWNTNQQNVQAIMKFFGIYPYGSNENFEIIVRKDGKTLFDIYPKCDCTGSSTAENALEVASVKRLGYLTSQVQTRLATGKLIHGEHNRVATEENDNWLIREGELELYDWYVYVKTSENEARDIRKIWIWINNAFDPNGKYVTWKDPDNDNPENTFPKKHGGMEADPQGGDTPSLRSQDNLVVGVDNIFIKYWPEDAGQEAEDDWVKVYIVAAPACMAPNLVLLLKPGPVTIQVKVW